jgi:hypothetical protein
MYVLFLRKETFFTSNRWYLILGLISSFVLPLITFTKTVWVDSKPVVFEQITNYEPAFIQNATAVEESVNWNELFIAFYSIIALIFILKIGFEIASFYRTIKNQQRTKEQHFTLIQSSKTNNPFSFFCYIVVNQQQFSKEELNHILLHESIHVKQKHSFDVLFSRIICAILWINPVVWLYRKAIIQNLEYIADNETFLTINNKYAYQKTLLKVVTSNNQLSINNHFFQSLIKKRIVMLNTNQSHKKNSWKYALLLPVLVAFMLLFQIETVAQSKDEPAEKVSYVVTSNYSSIVTKNTTDQEIKELEKAFSGEKQKLKISNVKRNSNSEIIAIKLEFDYGKTYNRVMERKSDKGINSIKIYINSDKNDDLAYGFEDHISIAAVDETIEIDGLVANITKSKKWSLDSMKKDGKEVVLIVNGKVKAPKEKVEISFDEELGDMKEISMSEFEKKYNKKADKDKLYYEVNTFKLPTVKGSYNELAKPSQEKEKTSSGYSFSYETSGPERNVELIKENKTVDYKKALIIYDGKEISPTELETIDPNSIASVSSMIATEYALKEYGERAKNGVVIIESQAYFKKNNPNLKTDLETFVFKLDSDNDGFVIGKNSTKEDLSFYKTTLARSNISFSFSGIKRNDKGEITAISLTFSKDDVKIKRNFKSTNPIPSLFIGKKNDKIVIEESN